MIGVEKTVAFVVARLDSSRLKAKQFCSIGDRPLLEWTLRQLEKSREIDQIVITTVAEEANRPLQRFAEQQGVDCFWYEGDPNHVTHRLRCAAESYKADICLLISGDCPLVDAEILDRMIATLRGDPCAQVVAVSANDRGQPAVEGMGAYRRQAWQRGDDLSTRPEWRENHFPVVWQNPEQFPLAWIDLPDDYYGAAQRLSVDTPADLRFMNRLYRTLTEQRQPFELRPVLQLLQREPALRKINDHVHQRQLGETHPEVLYAIDAGPAYGSGHLMRSRDLGLRMVEQLSWPVTFMVDDPSAAEALLCQGGRVVWGAVGREANPMPSALAEQVDETLPAHQLVLLDLYPRSLDGGWRDTFAVDAALVVVDSLMPWAQKADLIIVPGVTAPSTPPEGFPPVKTGLDYVLLRREVHEQQGGGKEVDILAYLHEEEKQQQIVQAAKERGLSLIVATGGSDRFVADLARAHLFVGNFGVSAYEALALGTLPVVWPLSPRHADEARQFYRAMGLPDLVIDSVDELASLWPELGREGLPAVTDGTPAVLQLLQTLMEGEL